ncbi:MAG: hypothetical protein CL610_09880 [Anaerolineaceae bacterium]|nr:hypothetical protein [Anaerolineaceae bacterium]
MADLATLLADCGLIQFGRFDHQQPYQLHLELLPSYPDVLEQITKQAVSLVGEAIDHLVCMHDALPLGTALSLKTEIPLVYSRGILAGAPVDNLVGAYDIGHPALLITNSLRDADGIAQIVRQAHQVGLEINRVLTLVDEGNSAYSDLETVAILPLSNILDALEESGSLPPGHGRVVREWLSLHHQG